MSDANAIKALLEKMDKDVAARFVVSALSLKKQVIDAALTTACQEMAIRDAKKQAEILGQKFEVVEKPLKKSLKKEEKSILNNLQEVLGPLLKKKDV
jgi:hypothetical protein